MTRQEHEEINKLIESENDSDLLYLVAAKVLERLEVIDKPDVLKALSDEATQRLFNLVNSQTRATRVRMDKSDLDVWHDVIFEALRYFEIVDETRLEKGNLIALYNALPERIKKVAEVYGVSDTDFKESAYAWYTEKTAKRLYEI